MKTLSKNLIRMIPFVITSSLLIELACAGGSIGWVDVKSTISKSDPEVIKLIERDFIVADSGDGIRLGAHFGERAGERIAPFKFDAVNRKTQESLILIIEHSEDHELTGRYKLSTNHVPEPELSEKEFEEMMAESEKLTSQLEKIEEQAQGKNPELKAREITLAETVEEAIVKAHPQIKTKRERIARIETESASALLAGNDKLFDKLQEEGWNLHSEIAEAEHEVMEQEGIQNMIQAYKKDILEAMSLIEPKTPELIQRQEKLRMRMQSHTGGCSN